MTVEPQKAHADTLGLGNKELRVWGRDLPGVPFKMFGLRRDS